jgi:hypothetical protein
MMRGAVLHLGPQVMQGEVPRTWHGTTAGASRGHWGWFAMHGGSRLFCKRYQVPVEHLRSREEIDEGPSTRTAQNLLGALGVHRQTVASFAGCVP